MSLLYFGVLTAVLLYSIYLFIFDYSFGSRLDVSFLKIVSFFVLLLIPNELKL